MKKEFIALTETLEAGIENISGKLRWLIRTAVLDTCPPEAINSIVYNPDIPEGVWGLYNPELRGICINLDQHFAAALEAVSEPDAMHTSIRLLIIRDLLDTAFHEAWHAKKCHELGDFTNGNLDEEGAKEYAWNASWEFGKNTDVEIDHFGSIIDERLAELYKELQECVEEDDCPEWKKLQLHMMVNGLTYYHPGDGVELHTIRECMEAQVGPEYPWGDPTADFRHYVEVQPATENEPVSQPAHENVVQEAAPQTVPAGYDPLEDMQTVVVEQPTDKATVTLAQPAAPAPQQPAMDVLQIQQIAETVMRRLFHHVYSKCEFNTAGGFNNPSAVLEPVSIQDIPGAPELFVKQDTVDEYGRYISKADTDGFIKGMVSKQGLPMYRLWLNIGGQLHKRTFIPQNPNKTKADGSLTAWANKVRNGHKIMMLLQDNMGPTADIQLEPGLPLGQEKFKVWSK